MSGKNPATKSSPKLGGKGYWSLSWKQSVMRCIDIIIYNLLNMKDQEHRTSCSPCSNDPCTAPDVEAYSRLVGSLCLGCSSQEHSQSTWEMRELTVTENNTQCSLNFWKCTSTDLHLLECPLQPIRYCLLSCLF